MNAAATVWLNRAAWHSTTMSRRVSNNGKNNNNEYSYFIYSIYYCWLCMLMEKYFKQTITVRYLWTHYDKVLSGHIKDNLNCSWGANIFVIYCIISKGVPNECFYKSLNWSRCATIYSHILCYLNWKLNISYLLLCYNRYLWKWIRFFIFILCVILFLFLAKYQICMYFCYFLNIQLELSIFLIYSNVISKTCFNNCFLATFPKHEQSSYLVYF